MHLTIDSSETPASLRLAAAILTFIANHKESPQTVVTPVAPTPPTVETVSTVSDPIEPLGETNPPPPPPKDEEPLLDSAGEKWDPELHTANQSKISDGTWRRKRTSRSDAGAPKTVELPKVPPPPPVTSQPTVEPTPTASSTPIVETAPAVPTAPVVPPAPPVSTVVSPTHNVTTFPALVKFVTNLVGLKKITGPQILEACAAAGVVDIHACALPQNLPLIPAVATAVQMRAAA